MLSTFEIIGLGEISILLFIVLLVWTLIWKGLALWKSARNRQMAWFIVLLVLNTVGILEIIYIVWFQKKKKAAAKPSRKRSNKKKTKKTKKRKIRR